MTASTQLLGPMILPTGVRATDEAQAEVLRIINDGTATSGGGVVTLRCGTAEGGRKNLPAGEGRCGMKIYDEAGALLAGEPDLARGYLTQEQRLVAHRKAVAEKSHLEVMEGTEGCAAGWWTGPHGPPGTSTRLWGVYHPYTAEELAARDTPTTADRLSACEAAILELAELAAGGA